VRAGETATSTTGGKGSRPVVSALFVLALALAPLAALADAERDFRQAMDLIVKKRWTEAATLLESAIGERPQEDKKPIFLYGQRYEPYLPHYHLGRVRDAIGDCAGAVQAWEQSQRQGVVRDIGGTVLSTLDAGLARCRPQVVEGKGGDSPGGDQPGTTPGPGPSADDDERQRREAALAAALGQLEQAVSDADAARGSFEESRRGLERSQVPLPGDFASRSAALDRELQATRGVLDRRASATPERVREAETGARRVATAFGDLRRELASVAAGAQRDRIALVQRLERAREEALRLLATAPSAIDAAAVVALRQAADQALILGGDEPMSLLREREIALQQARSGFEDAVAAIPVGPGPGPQGGIDPQGGATNLPVPPLVTPPAGRSAARGRLLAAAEAFWSGEYERALEELEQAAPAAERGQLTRHLLLAATRHALWVRSGQSDVSLLAGVKADIKACSLIDETLDPEALGLSPAFARIYREHS
jgi:hypothetical protein